MNFFLTIYVNIIDFVSLAISTNYINIVLLINNPPLVDLQENNKRKIHNYKKYFFEFQEKRINFHFHYKIFFYKYFNIFSIIAITFTYCCSPIIRFTIISL